MKVTKEVLKVLIKKFFKNIESSGITDKDSMDKRSTIVDDVYNTVTEKELLEIIRSNPFLVTDISSKPKSDLTDCDDYALQLKASVTTLYRQKMLKTHIEIFPPAVGIVITQKHALNIVACETEKSQIKIYLIDPSEKSPKLIKNSKDIRDALVRLPVKLIYL